MLFRSAPHPRGFGCRFRALFGHWSADWERVGAEARLVPCACGSKQRATLQLREVDTSVCLDCRRDRSGVTWPADPYDGYVQDLDTYIAAGLVEPRSRIEVALNRPSRDRSTPPPPAENGDQVVS